jgi:hypothetical protein
MNSCRPERLAVFLVMLTVGCASRQRAEDEGACVPVAPAVVAAAGMPVFAACEVEVRVGTTRKGDFVPFYPTPIGRTGCFIVAVEFVVDPSGLAIPATQRVRQSSDASMLRNVLATIYNTQYVPAMKGGRNVAQLVRERRTANVKYWTAYGNQYQPVFDDLPGC